MYALLNFIYARQKGGKVIMRSEDTDPVRSKREFEDAIKEDLKWLGVEWDEFYRQSERTDIYKKYIKQLIESDHAYLSTEEKIEADGIARVERAVVRFKNPNKVVTFVDMARGEISVDTTDLNDFIIARDLNSPLYHLTVVADDIDMVVTHVIRGEDGLANTPRQILIQEALEAPRPVYCHYPFVLATNRSKMGKRNGAIGISEYRAQGYLPETLANFIMLNAWHPKSENGVDQELFTLPELIEKFELERIGKSGAIFDQAKLDWLNREHMKKLSPEDLLEKAKPFLPNQESEKFLPLLLERINKFGDLKTLIEPGGEYDFLTSTPEYAKELLIGKSGASTEEITKHLNWVLQSDFSKDSIFAYATEQGRGKVLWPLRVALSGKEKSPDPFTLIQSLGLDESRKRIQTALDKLV